MSTAKQKQFTIDAERIVFDLRHRQTIRFNMSKYHAAVDRGRARYANLAEARNRAAAIKRHTLANLDEYLLQFERNFTANGGIVLWAATAAEAQNHLMDIMRKHNAKMVVKSKSMTTEEIHCNELLEANGIEAVETDLGEYIVQLAGEKPYHIVTPAMHKSKNDVAKLFNQKFGFPLDSTPEQMTALARKNLREKYLSADVGITGANFVVADVGGIAVTENEGNGLMSTAFPKVHVAIAGIEKIIPAMHYLSFFWPHLSLHGTGQAITVYNTLFTGPRKPNETDGPDSMYVILLDNGRTNLYENQKFRVALSCIRCGACLNACPIYKNVGGYTYNTTYQGPIGKVITPHLRDLNEFKHLSTACSICGSCADACPMRIPLNDLLLETRAMAVAQGFTPLAERLGMKFFKTAVRNHKIMNFFGGGIKNTFLKPMFGGLWGKKRDFPHFAKRSFRDEWKKRR